MRGTHIYVWGSCMHHWILQQDWGSRGDGRWGWVVMVVVEASGQLMVSGVLLLSQDLNILILSSNIVRIYQLSFIIMEQIMQISIMIYLLCRVFI